MYSTSITLVYTLRNYKNKIKVKSKKLEIKSNFFEKINKID